MSDWEVYDRRFHDCLVPTARIEKLFTGTGWAEGPVWSGDGDYLLFSDIPNNRMLRWMDGVPVTMYRSPSEYSNGNTRDRDGRLITCEHGRRCVTRTEHDGRITTIADRYAGKRLNSPNDVVVANDGAIWFTDPPYGILSDYEGHKAESEQDGNYVYRVDPVSGKVEVVADDFAMPNGLVFSPDESILYVADSGLSHDENGPHHVRRFAVSDGRLSGGEVFAVVSPGVPDGLRTDTDGNVWISCGDGVLCYTAGGDLIGKICVPEAVANLTFGGRNRDRLFMTAHTSLYSLFVNVRGAEKP